MRYFTLCVTLLFTVFLVSCGNKSSVDRLAYQRSALFVEATFVLGDESVPVTMNISEAQYADDGRMLSRDATLVFGGNSIISGVCFEFSSGRAYVSSGELKIPIEDTSVIGGISDMISLFCISDEYYYSSENVKQNGLKCEKSVYVNGENSVEITLDLSCMLPTDIIANIDGRTLSAHINLIKAE